MPFLRLAFSLAERNPRNTHPLRVQGLQRGKGSTEPLGSRGFGVHFSHARCQRDPPNGPACFWSPPNTKRKEGIPNPKTLMISPQQPHPSGSRRLPAGTINVLPLAMDGCSWVPHFLSGLGRQVAKQLNCLFVTKAVQTRKVTEAPETQGMSYDVHPGLTNPCLLI